MRALLILVLAVPCAIDAQSPPPPPGKLSTNKIGTPTLPPNPTLPIEVVKTIPQHFQIQYYERAGYKPREYRVSTSPQMTGAVWQTFTEGAVQTKTVNGRTVTTGTITHSVSTMGSTCAPNSVWSKAYLQFRSVNPLNNVIMVSNVKGDSACLSLGG